MNRPLFSGGGPIITADLWPLFPGLGWPFHPGPNIALSLIGALHKNAPLRGPIIMDSPFGRLDPTHKKRIITALPSMSDQIILLAYTDEIDSQTAREVLGNSLKKEYRLTKHNSFYTEIELQ